MIEESSMFDASMLLLLRNVIAACGECLLVGISYIKRLHFYVGDMVHVCKSKHPYDRNYKGGLYEEIKSND